MKPTIFNLGTNTQEILHIGEMSELSNIISKKSKNNELDPKHSVVLFDLDLTIFDRDGIMSDVYADKRKYFIKSVGPILAEVAYAQSPYHLIEEKVTNIIQELKAKGFTVLGFTSRRTGKVKSDSKTYVQEDACVSLKNLGVSFSLIPDQEFDIKKGTVQLENPNLLPYEKPSGPMIFGQAYGASTIFTANYPKGFILGYVIKYFARQSQAIKHVIVADDNSKYLQDIKQFCEGKKMAFTGLHYTYAEDNKNKKPLNEDVVSIQQETLINEKKFLSEEEALKMIQKKTLLNK